MASRIKMTDVARMAKVSSAVVSAVLNGRQGGSIRVSEETRQRITVAAKELGYVADPLAVSLAGGRRNLIGVFTYEALFPVEHRDFYNPFLVGIEEEAERSGYDLVLFTRTRDATGRRRVYRDGVNHLRLADGAILLGADPDRGELERLLDEDFPFVYVGRRTSRLNAMSYSAADYVSATAEMVDYLVNKGHRELAMLTTGEDNEYTLDRDQGFALGIARHELALRKITLPTAAVTLDTVRGLLNAGVTAFVVARDDRARAVLKVTDALGLRAGRCPQASQQRGRHRHHAEHLGDRRLGERPAQGAEPRRHAPLRLVQPFRHRRAQDRHQRRRRLRAQLVADVRPAARARQRHDQVHPQRVTVEQARDHRLAILLGT